MVCEVGQVREVVVDRLGGIAFTISKSIRGYMLVVRTLESSILVIDYTG